MIYGQICVFILVVLPATFAQTDYCDENLCSIENRPHIACRNRGGFSSNCQNPEIIKISQEMKENILDHHNSLRNKIAKGHSGFPPAVRMATLVWDDELAKLAELNVKQCKMKHDQCRNTKKFQYAGQNLAHFWWYNLDYTVSEITTNQIQSWFDEYSVCPKNIIHSYKSSTNLKYGHFTAMVRDESTHVGCAIIRYEKNGYLMQDMACNYASTNLLGYPIYVAGKTASKCTSGTHKKYKALCSTKENYNKESLNIKRQDFPSRWSWWY